MGRRDDYEDDDDYGAERRSRSRPARRGFRCLYCETDELPIKRTRVAPGGWVVLVILLLFCLPLFWVGLLIKEEYRECYECGIRLGR
jgi:hypothetical protein